nr:hypothetical protein [Tanacetum cinerariifolium]
EFKGGSVAFGGSNGSIIGKGKINAGRLDFEDIYYVEELKHYNLFSVSQMCDKKNKVLFTDTDCLVLSSDFKLPDENQGKQHKASCKAKTMSSVNQPLQILHMDLFRTTSDETTPILKDFIRQAENQFNHKVKTIRSDNGTEFKKNDLIEFYGLKGIKREYSNARTLQQNEVVERKNMTLIEAARTMVLVTKPQNNTPNKLLIGFLVGYSLNSKAFRVYNLETKRVEENLHVNVLENKPNVAGKGHAWMFDLDYLTNSMNYEPVSVENQANKSTGLKEANNSACIQANDDQGANSEETNLHDEHFVLPIWSAYSTIIKSSGDNTPISTAGPSKVLNDGEHLYPDDPSMPHLRIFMPVQVKGFFLIHPIMMKVWQEEGIDYDEVFTHVARIEAIRIFLAFTSYIGFIVYQMDMKSAFLYSTIDEEVYVIQPPGFVDPKFLNKVKQKEDGIFISQDKYKDGIFISQDKYVAEILKKFNFLIVKTGSTPIETQKPLIKDEVAVDVDVHLYRSMIGSLMYLTVSRPDIMFAVYACSRFQVTSKASHL